MMGNTKNIVIVRHGETQWNIERKLQGQENSDLTKLGIKQTELVARSLKNEHFDICISSDLPRCIKTSDIILKDRDIRIVYESRLRERNFGHLQGMTKEKIKDCYPYVYEKLNTGNINFEVPNGESMSEFFSRVDQGLDFIINNFQQKNILIITHGGVLDCIMRKIMKLSLDNHRCFSIYNTSINRFSVNSFGWKLESWGDINHLKSVVTIDDF